MQVIHDIAELRAALAEKDQIAFVPTMGNLHAGHISLVELAKQKVAVQENACVVVSIFVNPLQFGAGEDLDSYPRTLDADFEKLTAAGTDIVFVPSVTSMYPDANDQGLQQTMTITAPPIAQQLCGASRPGHFEGVATVVMKLFNLVQPDIAVFGKKDYQQLMVIRQLVRQFNLPIDIIGGEIVREESGLALSSRNGYLTLLQKQQATQLNAVLKDIATQIENGLRDYPTLMVEAADALRNNGWDVDYIAICNADNLSLAKQNDENLVVLGAASLGKTRLIDNIVFCAKPLN